MVVFVDVLALYGVVRLVRVISKHLHSRKP
jgi:hypothetical protein